MFMESLIVQLSEVTTKFDDCGKCCIMGHSKISNQDRELIDPLNESLWHEEVFYIGMVCVTT